VSSVSASGAQVKIGGAGQPPPPMGVHLVAAHSGKCLGIEGASTTREARIIQSVCNGAPDQAWSFVKTANGNLNIKNLNSGMCVDVYAHNTSSGAKVVQWDCNGQTNQVFQLVDSGNGTAAIKGVESGKCLDIYGASTADGAQLIQWTCH